MSKTTLPRACSYAPATSVIDPTAPGGVEAMLDFHRATFGDARMEDASPERPEGVTEEEWTALGDPGKAALVREREARRAAEQERDAAKAAKPTPPANAGAPAGGGEGGKGEGDDPPDVAALIQQAVEAAVAPFQQRQAQWEAEQAATRIREAVVSAASPRFHDPSDALAQVDLAALTDGNGGADAAKITAALDDLATRKPHLVKPWDDRRRVAPGSPIGGSADVTAIPLDDRVKATLARMQSHAGIRPAS